MDGKAPEENVVGVLGSHVFKGFILKRNIRQQRKRVRDILDILRILRGCRVTVCRATDELEATSWHSPSSDRHVIHGWREDDPIPSDFELHEVLHCALHRLISMDKRKMKEIIQAEEALVQDLCIIVESWGDITSGK